MNIIADSLVTALCNLPKEDKREAIRRLLIDQEFRFAISDLLLDRVNKIQPSASNSTTTNITNNSEISYREYGKQQRAELIIRLKQKGVQIDYTGSIWGKILSNKWVAIPYANERQQNRWFLGIGEKDLKTKKQLGKIFIILLCQTENRDMLEFIIPNSLVDDILPSLSISKGQYKFNLRRNGQRFQLSLPGRDPIDITDYNGQISNLK